MATTIATIACRRHCCCFFFFACGAGVWYFAVSVCRLNVIVLDKVHANKIINVAGCAVLLFYAVSCITCLCCPQFHTAMVSIMAVCAVGAVGAGGASEVSRPNAGWILAECWLDAGCMRVRCWLSAI